MTRGEHPDSQAVAATICAALKEPAVAAGFAPGQPHAEAGRASVIFCSAPDTVARSLRGLIDDDTHGPEGPHCIDLTIEAGLQAGGGWALARADVESESLVDAALALGRPDLVALLAGESLSAVSLETALSRVAELLATAVAAAVAD